LRYASIGALVTTLVIIPLAYLMIRQAGEISQRRAGISRRSRRGAKFIAKLKPRAQSLEERVYGFYAKASELLSIFALDMCFHLAGVLEISSRFRSSVRLRRR
jgi:hypothetical protein